MYIELHSRSAFSFLEGASIPEDLIAVCANLGMPAMALLDRDGVYGSPRFHLAAKKVGIKAHIGAEVTCAAFSPRKRPSFVVAGLRPAWTGPSPVHTRKRAPVKSVLCFLLLLTLGWVYASKRDAKKDTLANYLARVQMGQPAAPTLSLGSIWVDSGRMASLSADYKAMAVGDLIEIVVVQGVTASNANAVSTARTFSAN